jgi:hypothetical protein
MTETASSMEHNSPFNYYEVDYKLSKQCSEIQTFRLFNKIQFTLWSSPALLLSVLVFFRSAVYGKTGGDSQDPVRMCRSVLRPERKHALLMHV